MAPIDRDALAALRAQPLPGPAMRLRGSRRPRMVLVATAIVLGCGLLNSAVPALALLVDKVQPVSGEAPIPAGFLGWVVRNALVLAKVQLVCGVITLSCGVAAWAHQRWARRASQVVMGGWGVLSLGWAVILAVDWPVTFHNQLLDASLKGAMLAAGLSGAVPAFVPVWLFEHRDVKEWFSAPDKARPTATRLP